MTLSLSIHFICERQPFHSNHIGSGCRSTLPHHFALSLAIKAAKNSRDRERTQSEPATMFVTMLDPLTLWSSQSWLTSDIFLEASAWATNNFLAVMNAGVRATTT